MAIQVTCSNCGSAHKVKDELAGTSGQCPKCQAEYVVPAASAATSPKKQKASAGKGSSKEQEDFDPAEFLASEPVAPRPVIPINLSDEPKPKRGGSTSGNDENGSERPIMGTTDTNAAAGFASEKDWNHAQQAKLMKKALKASRTALKEEEKQGKNEGVDVTGIIREVGLKLGGGLLAICLVVYFFNQWVNSMMGSGLKLPPLGLVSGIVTLDGKPLEGATVFFAPKEDSWDVSRKKERARTSIGIVDAQGKYKLVYIEGHDGAAVGVCRVWITPPMSTERIIIPPEFTEATMATREVTANKNEHNFVMKSR